MCFRLDANSRHSPGAQDAISTEEIRFTLGERLILLLNVLAFKHEDAGEESVVVADAKGAFTSEVSLGLVEKLHLPPDEPATAELLSGLSKEFADWARQHDEARARFGISFDPLGRIILKCKADILSLGPIE